MNAIIVFRQHNLTYVKELKSMGFTESIKHCLKNAVKSKGRGSRSEFWWFFLYYLIFVYAGILFVAAWDTPFSGLLYVAFIFYHLIALANAGVRRMHDVGKHGIFYFIPLINLYFAVQPGDLNPNKYGDPTSK